MVVVTSFTDALGDWLAILFTDSLVVGTIDCWLKGTLGKLSGGRSGGEAVGGGGNSMTGLFALEKDAT